MGNLFRVCALALCVSLACQPAGAYSLLTHEQLIDLTWQSSIVPLLRSRYPKITDEQLEEARSYAYAGCVVQDIGYYPFGDPFVIRSDPLRPNWRLHRSPFPRRQGCEPACFCRWGALSLHGRQHWPFAGDQSRGGRSNFPSLQRNMDRSLLMARTNMPHVRQSSPSTSTRLRTTG